MNNNFTNSINFKFAPVSTFAYANKPKYAAGVLHYDDAGNAEFKVNSYNYCDYNDLLNYLQDNFDTDYFYRNVTVEFYGKNTRTVKIGRTYLYVSAEDKIDIDRTCFLPDLMLGLRLVNMYDKIGAYAFNKKFHFINKTDEEILDFFEVAFTKYELNKQRNKEQRSIPTPATCWQWYLNEIKNTYANQEWNHSHCSYSNEYDYRDEDYKSTFRNVDYTFPVTFKIIGNHGTFITSRYNREYEILEVKAIDPHHNVTFCKPSFIVYAPKNRDIFTKVYTHPDFEKYIRKDAEFESILEATSDYVCGFLKDEIKTGKTVNAKVFLNDCKHCDRLGSVSSPFKYSYEHNTPNIKSILIYNDEWSCETWNLSL